MLKNLIAVCSILVMTVNLPLSMSGTVAHAQVSASSRPAAGSVTGPATGSTSSGDSSATVVSVLLTYRASSLSSRLARDGARLRALNEPGISITELDLDGENGTLSAVRRLLSDSKTKVVLALETSIDVGFIPLIDSLGLSVVSSSFLEGAISSSTKGLYSVYPRIAGVREAVVRFFLAQPNVRTFGILCSNSRLGLRYSEIWDETGRTRGVTVPRASCGNERSFDARVALLRAKGQQIDAFGVGFGVVNVMTRLRDMEWPQPLLLSATEGEQLIYEDALDKGSFTSVFFDAPVLSELFVRALAVQYSERPATISSALGYEAVSTLLNGIKVGGDLVGALRKVSYDGVSGPVDFTVENTGNGSKSVLMHLEAGKAVRMH